MSGYLELVEYICLVISIGNFIAIGFTLKKKKQIFKTMYFINPKLPTQNYTLLSKL